MQLSFGDSGMMTVDGVPADSVDFFGGGFMNTEPQFMADVPGSRLFFDASGNVVDEFQNVIIPASTAAAEIPNAPDGANQSPSDPALLAAARSIEGQVGGGPGPLADVNQFLGTPLGKILASLGLGGAGLGIAAGVAGGTPRISLPQPPQTPGQTAVSNLFAQNPAASQALQQSILQALQASPSASSLLGQQLGQLQAANLTEAPVQAGIRSASLGDLLSQQQGGPPADPVTAALRNQILSITAKGTNNPLLEQLFAKQREEEVNRQFAAHGPQWAQTSPGMEAERNLSESQGIQTYQDYLSTIGALTGPYLSGRGQGLTASTGLSQLGLPNTQQTIGSLNSIASPGQVGGLDTSNTAALQAQNAQDNLAIQSLLAQSRAQTGLGTSLAQLFGRASANAFGMAA